MADILDEVNDLFMQEPNVSVVKGTKLAPDVTSAYFFVCVAANSAQVMLFQIG